MTLKIDDTSQTVNAASKPASQKLLCCFDVSKASLSLFAQYEPGAGPVQGGGRPCQIEEQLPNQTGAIEQVLDRLEGVAEEVGLEGLLVLAEPTGGYERKLLQTARRLGHGTGLISPEHVARLKTVESNDTGKTDHKDPRVMHLVARLGKTQTDRHLPETYRRLRRLTRYYDEDEETLTAARQRIQAVIQDLFPDYDKSATFTFDTTGQALMEAYAFDPYHIQRAGLGRFKNTMRRRVGAHTSTLDHLYSRAEESARYHKTEAEVELLAWRARPARLKTSVPGGRCSGTPASTCGNARAAPIGDRPGSRKRGGPLLRKILGQTIFPVLRKAMLYGPYYHRKLGEGMIAAKAKVAVMRKFLCMLHSLARSGEAFDPGRFRQCESQYALAK